MKTIIPLISILLTAVVTYSQNGLSSISLPTTYTPFEMRYRSGIASDASNNLWVAFQFKGLAKYDGASWTLFDSANSQLPCDTIFSLCTFNNLVYIGTLHGLTCFNGSTWTTWTTADGLAGERINGIYCDAQNLIVTSEKYMSVKTGTAWSNILIPNSDYSNITVYSYNNYHTPVFSDPSGYIWIGRSDAGLLIYNGTSWETKTYMENPIPQPTAFTRDQSGRIWIGTTNTTYIYNGAYVVNVDQLFPDWNGYPPQHIYSFANNPSGEIFFSAGMYRYILNDELITIQVPVPGGWTLLCCYNNGVYRMLSLMSDSAKVYSFDYSQHNDYGNSLKPGVYKYLDANMVKAGYGNRGVSLWDFVGNPQYEVPKGSGKHSLFCSSVWVAGLDAIDSLHLSAGKYNTGGVDFFPGPLRLDGTTDTASCRPYDHIWKVYKSEIDSVRQWYADGSLGSGTHLIPDEIATWPAHGDIQDGFDYHMAPFVDTDGNDIYEPANGDYPLIRGNQMLWWVYNDNLAPHTELSGQPLGVEIRASAFVYACDTASAATEAINYTTFMHYEIFNRSPNTYHDCYIGIFVDGDIGDHSDDYVGSNVGNNSFYFYNGDEMDGDGNGKTYGANPPCQSVAVLHGPWAPSGDGIDNDHDSDIDEQWKSIQMSGFTYFNNSQSVMGDPVNAEEGYNYLKGLWRDGAPLQYGDTGYNTGGVNCRYMFPGDSDPLGYGTGGISQPAWSEVSESNSPGDRRGVASMGPFTWAPGETHYIDIAFIWSRSDSGGAWASVEKNFLETTDIIQWYNNGGSMAWLYGGDFPYCDQLPMNTTENILSSRIMEIYPNPATNIVYINPHMLAESYSIELLSFSGQRVIQIKGKGQTELDVSDLPKGIYIIRMIGSNRIESRKLIIQ